MSDLSPPLPNPPCGAISPDGDACPSDSTVIVASEWPTGYATAIWRCHGHLGESVEAAVQLSPHSVVTVTPLEAIENIAAATAEPADEPNPDSPTGDRPSLRLVR
jgi:hypothetical protein